MYKKTKLGFCIIWINDISHTYGRNFGFSLLANTDRNSLKSVATRARELSTMAAICRVETLVLLVLIAAIPATSTYYKGDTRDDTRSWKKDDVDDTKDDTRDDDDKTSQKKLLGKSTSGLKNDDEDDTKDYTRDDDDTTSQKKLVKYTRGWKNDDEDDTGEQIDLQDIGEYENDVMDLLIKQARLQNTSLEQGFIYTNKTEEVFSKKITRKLKRVHKS